MRFTSDERDSALILALLRVSLLVVILLSQKLTVVTKLVHASFWITLGAGAVYAVAALALALSARRGRHRERLGQAVPVAARLAPALDVALLTVLAATSGGGFADVRRAFYVIPLAAAFSERPRRTAAWSLLAVAVFSLQAMVVGNQPVPSHTTWWKMTLNQDMYLAWIGGAATLLAVGLRRRSAEIEELAASRQQLVTRAIDAVERERTRLAGALHDSPVQNLIAARHDLRRAERTGDEESFARLHEALDLTIADLREEIFNLHPHVLDHVGLRAALEQVARRHAPTGAPRITIEVPAEAELPRGPLPHREVLFALGRELLANAAKHSGASTVAVRVNAGDTVMTMEVVDDGCGIPAGRPHQALIDGHIGLAESRERVIALGGTFELLDGEAPVGGTRVRITLPLDQSCHPLGVNQTVTKETPIGGQAPAPGVPIHTSDWMAPLTVDSR